MDLPKFNYIVPGKLFLHTVHGTNLSLPRCAFPLAQGPQSRSLTPDPFRDFSTEVRHKK